MRGFARLAVITSIAITASHAMQSYELPKLINAKPEKDWEQRKYKKPKKGKRK